jgi:hypothetical protein
MSKEQHQKLPEEDESYQNQSESMDDTNVEAMRPSLPLPSDASVEIERKASYTTEHDISHADFIDSQESLRNLQKQQKNS